MAYCCVPGCTSYQRRECDQGLSFHRFPSNPDTRRQWIAKINRDVGPYFQITDNRRVCSKHFSKDCIERSLTGLNKLKKGTVPSLFTWCQPKTRRAIQRIQSSKQVLEALCDHDYEEETLSVEEQLDAAQREIARLEEENKNLKSEQFHLRRFQCEPKLIMFYTGFKDYDTVKAVFLALKPTAVSMFRWSQMQRLNQREEHIVKDGFHAQHLTVRGTDLQSSLRKCARVYGSPT